MSFLSFEMTELDQNIFDTVILEHPVGAKLGTSTHTYTTLYQYYSIHRDR